MSVLEITLLVLGLIAFFGSFFIPDKQSGGELDSYSMDEIKNLVDSEIENMKDKLNDSADETINYSIEKAERSLERITNEKMIALGEYSDTIMTQINKNHQETVFLSDMLNKNKNDLTVFLGQAVTDSKTASESAKKAIDTAEEAIKESEKALSNARNAKEMVIFAEDKMITARKDMKNADIKRNDDSATASTKTTGSELIDTNVSIPEAIDNSMDSTIVMPEAESPAPKKTTRKKKNQNEVVLKDGVLVDNDGQISLKFDADEENSKNNNDKVLKLHKKGKSNVAIAKELGLGIGEVKLVIDLFENKKK